MTDQNILKAYYPFILQEFQSTCVYQNSENSEKSIDSSTSSEITIIENKVQYCWSMQGSYVGQRGEKGYTFWSMNQGKEPVFSIWVK